MLTRHEVSAFALWLSFIAVHLVLGLLNLNAQGLPLGDVTIVYARWAEQAYASGVVVGVDTPWVYPLLALVPILASVTFGLEHIAATWLTLVMILNLVALGFLTRWGRSRAGVFAGWWWVIFLLALGPIAVGRIDAVTVAVAIVGVRLLLMKPRVAGVILACATWIKVWPAALLLAAFIALRERWTIAIAAAATTATVIVFALLAGSEWNVFTFIAEQTNRGVQIESPVAAIWLWQIVAGVSDTFIYYDSTILTFQVAGAGVNTAAAVMTPLLGLVVVGIVGLGFRASRSGASAMSVLSMVSLALISALITVNKVGSPQFISWLAVPVVLGLLVDRAEGSSRFRVPATFGVLLAALTHTVYPYLYHLLLGASPALIAILTLRNLLLLALLVWSIVGIVRLASPRIQVGLGAPHSSHPTPARPTSKEPAA